MLNNNVFSPGAINEFVDVFHISYKRTPSKGIQYVGVMLVDNLSGPFIPKSDNGKKSEVYYDSNLEDIFSNLIDKISKQGLPFLNEIIINYLTDEYYAKALFICFNSKESSYIIEEEKIPKQDIDKILIANLDQSKKNQCLETLNLHCELIEQDKNKCNKIKYIGFIPLTYFFGKTQILLYVTIYGYLKNIRCLNSIPAISKIIGGIIKQSTFSLMQDQIKYHGNLYYKQKLKTAIISILIDSYAHNISAHSLTALKWWFELRHKIIEKRFFIDQKKGLTLSAFQPGEMKIERTMLEDTTQKYYAALGLTDSIYNKQFYSLFDMLNFNSGQVGLDKLFSFQQSDQEYAETVKKVPEIEGSVSSVEVINGLGPNYRIPICFNPRFPVTIDYALYPFFRFLRDKGAFWSGVTRDMAFGGESKTWYQVLWEDFANNPLYLGSIAKSEGITKLKINFALKINGKWISGRFVTIDLSLMDYEERIAANPRQKIEYQKQDYDIIQPFLKELSIDGEQIKEKERSKINKDCLPSLDAKLQDLLFSVKQEEVNHCMDEHVGYEVHTKCKDSKDKYVESDKYSKYAFVRLGKCFTHFREIMSSDEFIVFLPGGVVGEHALFTIFENMLRNIKHYKDEHELQKIRNDGIDFWISIEPEKLNINDVIHNADKPNELFKVNVWLGHTTDMVIQEDGKPKHIWEKLSASTGSPILDSNGVPRMGGNSQDKACAAMLFNNNFNSVEDNQEDHKGKRNENYFPWVHFTTNCTPFPYDSDSDLPHSKAKCRIHQKDYDAEIKQYKQIKYSDNGSRGYLKKHFYMWKSDDYFIINNASDLAGENISRFKFVIISGNITDPEKQKEIINIARQEGVIRLLFDMDSLITRLGKDIPEEFKNEHHKKQVEIRDKRLRLLYSVWLKQWIPYVNNEFKISLFESPTTATFSTVRISAIEPVVVYSTPNSETINCSQIRIPLSHGGGAEFSSCNVRSHGAFWGKYFYKAKEKQPKDLFDINVIDETNKYLLMDFAEVVATNVFIFDNRLRSRMPVNDKKLGVFGESLKLVVEEEKPWTEKGSFGKHLSTIIKHNGIPNILVVHLSYIESLGYQERSKGFMNSFIEKELNGLINRDNFIFIIITGRGRNTWKDGLKKEYFRNVLFKPVESFIHAIESGISYNDNFDVKHNIIKVIFGS